MRHNKKFNHLGRKKAHRELMLSNMAVSLIMHKRIETTVQKAKALRVFVEPIITRSKQDTTLARRVAFDDLRDKYAVAELFREVAPRIMNRPGGYTRIVRLATRLGAIRRRKRRASSSTQHGGLVVLRAKPLSSKV